VLKLAQPLDGQIRYGMSWSGGESDVVLDSDGVSLHVDNFSVPFWAGAGRLPV
jgi:hypothetical protein